MRGLGSFDDPNTCNLPRPVSASLEPSCIPHRDISVTGGGRYVFYRAVIRNSPVSEPSPVVSVTPISWISVPSSGRELPPLTSISSVGGESVSSESVFPISSVWWPSPTSIIVSSPTVGEPVSSEPVFPISSVLWPESPFSTISVPWGLLSIILSSSTGDEFVSPTGNGFVSPTGDDFVSPTGNSFVSPTGDDFVSPTGDDFVSPTGDDFVSPTGNDFVSPTGNSFVTPTVNEFVTPTVSESVFPTVGGSVFPTVSIIFGTPTGSEVISDFHSESPPQSKSPPQPTSPRSSTPTDGTGVGISCSLVQSASSAYKDAISLVGTMDGNDALVSYYARVLHMACLRSSPRCNVPECSQVNNIQKVIPTECQGQEYLGDQFEEYVFRELVQNSSFSDVSSQQAKANSTVNYLTQQIQGGKIGSPFLNFMMSVGVEQDTRKLVQIYYGTVEVFGDLQPIFVKYIQGEIGSSDKGSIKDTIGKIARSHSQFLKCGISPSYFVQSNQTSESSQSIRRRDSTSTGVTLPPAAAAAASFFVPVVGVQLRNNEVIKALLSSKSLGLGNSSIEDLVEYLQGELPHSSELKFDTRNWLFPNPVGTQGSVNNNSESSALLDQSLVKQEMSKEAGSNVTFINELLTKMELDTSRDDQRLSDFMAASGLFFATPDGSQASKPIEVKTGAGGFTIVGPIGMVFPAASEFIPGMGASSNVSNPRASAPTEPNYFPPGSGGALSPVAPTDADITSVLYKSATLRIHVDPKHYIDADPKIDPSSQFYILDLVSGKKIPHNFDSTGNSSVYGTLEAQLGFGNGVWAGGWGGGGAFAVGVENWVEKPKGSATRMRMLTVNNQGILAVLGWVTMIIMLTSFSW